MYEHVSIAKGTDSIINESINVPRRSMKGLILLLFYEPYEGGTIERQRENIQSWHHRGESGCEWNPELSLQTGNENWRSLGGSLQKIREENSSMNVTGFYGGDRFALFVDLRSMGENQLHSSGLRLVNTKDGVQLTINRTMSGSGNVKRHIFIFSNAQFNIVNKELESVTYWFHIKFFQSRNMDWKKFRGWMSEISLDRSPKILGRARPYPKFGEFFSVHNVERKFRGRGTAFRKNQGVVGPESSPKTVTVVVWMW